MRPIAIILAVIAVCLTALTGYLYLITNMEVVGVGCVATDPVNDTETFESLKAQVTTGTFTGTPFHTDEIGDAGGYQYYTYTVRLKNRTFIDAQAVELQVTPMSDDVLQLPDESEHTLRSQATGDLSATILTTREAHNIRELTVTYYLWGLPFSTRLTYSRTQ